MPTPLPWLATSMGMAAAPTVAERVAEPPRASVTVSSTSCGELVSAGKAATAVPDLPVVVPDGAVDAQEPPATRCRQGGE